MMYRVCTVKDYEAGMETDLYNAAVYASSTCTTGSIKNGTFYIYDGVVVNGRVRITDKKENYGKKPLANYVTGWIDQTDVFFF